MWKPLNFVFNFLFKRKKNQIIELRPIEAVKFEELNNNISHVELLKNLIREHYLNQSKMNFTSQDLMTKKSSNDAYQFMFESLTKPQIRKALYKLQCKNVIIKEPIVISSKINHRHNLYLINIKYNW